MRRLAVLASLWLFVIAFIAISFVSAPISIEAMLADELSPIAWLTSLLLGMVACVAASRAVAGDEIRLWRFGALAAMALAASLDEWFMGHERLKEYLLWRFLDGSNGSLAFVADLPLLVVAVVGGLVVLPIFRSGRRSLKFLWLVSFSLALVAMFFDIAMPLHPWQYIEEVIEPLSVALFLSGLL